MNPPEAPASDPSIGKKSRRLPKPGTKLLEELFHNVCPNPTKSQREQWVKNLRTECGPEVEWYTEAHISQWCINRRRKLRLLAEKKSAFSQQHLETIRKLMEPLPSPPPETIAIWAKLIGSTVEQVEGMVKQVQGGQKDLEIEAGSSRTPSHKLPTPSLSTSPEPMSATDCKPEPSLSPIMLSSMTPFDPALSWKPSSPQVTHHSTLIPPPFQLPGRDEILQLIQDGLQSEQLESISDGDAAWAECANSLTRFLQSSGVHFDG